MSFIQEKIKHILAKKTHMSFGEQDHLKYQPNDI